MLAMRKLLARSSGVRGVVLLSVLLAALLRLEPDAVDGHDIVSSKNKLVVDPSASDLVDVAPLSLTFSDLCGGGGRGEEEEKFGPQFSSSTSWSWSSSPTASSAEQRRPLHGGRWSVSAQQPALLTEGRASRGLALRQPIQFFLAFVPLGGNSATSRRPLHRLASPVLATAAVRRQPSRPKWFVPGGVPAIPARKCRGTGLQSISLS